MLDKCESWAHLHMPLCQLGNPNSQGPGPHARTATPGVVTPMPVVCSQAQDHQPTFCMSRPFKNRRTTTTLVAIGVEPIYSSPKPVCILLWQGPSHPGSPHKQRSGGQPSTASFQASGKVLEFLKGTPSSSTEKCNLPSAATSSTDVAWHRGVISDSSAPKEAHFQGMPIHLDGLWFESLLGPEAKPWPGSGMPCPCTQRCVLVADTSYATDRTSV